MSGSHPSFSHYIHALYHRYLLILILLGGGRLLGALMITLGLAGWLDYLMIWSSQGRWAAWFCLILLILGLAGLIFIRSGRSLFPLQRFLSLSESLYPDHHNFLQNSYYLPLQYGQNAELEPLMEIMIDRAGVRMRNFKLSAFFPFNRIQPALWLSLAGLLSLILPALLLDHFSIHYQRIIRPWDSRLVPIAGDFTIFPGDTLILKNRSLTVTAQSKSAFNDDIILEYRYQGAERWREEAMTRLDPSRFEYRFKEIRQPLEYRIKTRFFASTLYRVEVTDYPHIKTFSYQIIPPAYTRQKTVQLEDISGDLMAMKGSMIRLSFTTDKPLSSAELVMNDQPGIPMRLEERQARLEWKAKDGGSFYFKITDTSNLSQPDPIRYSLTIQPDMAPIVKIIFPARDLDLGDDMVLPIQAVVSDDFGVSRLQLVYWINDSPERHTIPVAVNPLQKEQIISHIWDLTPLSLITEDVVSYYLKATDNDAVSGPKSSQTQTFTLRFPSLFEIMAEVERQQQQTMNGMEKSLRELDKMQQKIDQFQQEMKKENQISWDKQKELMDKLDQLQKQSEQIQEHAESFEQILQKMEQNQAVTEETMNKMKEVEKILQELDPKRLQDLMDRLKRDMPTMSEEQMMKELENLKKNQQDFKERLDRTLALLKKLQAEQKLSQMQQKLEEMEKRQQNLEDKLNEPDQKSNKSDDPSPKSQEEKPGKRPPNPEELRRQQAKIADQQQKLDQDMKEFQKMLQESDNKFAPEAQQLQQESDQMKMQEQMQDIQQQLKQNEMKKAGNQSKQLRKDMKDLQKKMSDLQKKMEMDDIMKIMEKMEQMYQNLLYTSQTQENLNQQLSQARAQDSRLSAIAREQESIYQTVKESADSLYQYSKQRSEISLPSMQRMGEALMDIREAVDKISNSRSYQPGENPHQNLQQARDFQGEALGDMNQAAFEMFKSIQALNDSKKSCSNPMPMPMAAMQQMAGAQSDLNQSIQQMMQQIGMGKGKMSPQQQERLNQLSNQQSELAKQLQQYMNQQMQKMENPSPKMNQTVQDMQQSALDLENRKLDDQLLKRNQQILSRLLDSDKSMREREKSQKRKAETAEPLQSRKVPELDAQIMFDTDSRKLMILEALKSRYPVNYELLIKSYFNQLLNYYQNQPASGRKPSPEDK